MVPHNRLDYSLADIKLAGSQSDPISNYKAICIFCFSLNCLILTGFIVIWPSIHTASSSTFFSPVTLLTQYTVPSAHPQVAQLPQCPLWCISRNFILAAASNFLYVFAFILSDILFLPSKYPIKQSLYIYRPENTALTSIISPCLGAKTIILAFVFHIHFYFSLTIRPLLSSRLNLIASSLFCKVSLSKQLTIALAQLNFRFFLAAPMLDFQRRLFTHRALAADIYNDDITATATTHPDS